MRKLRNKGLIKKLILVLCVILLFSTIFPNIVVNAEDNKNSEQSFGGRLLKPIVDFIVGLGDVVMDFIHSMVFGSGYQTLRIDMDNSLLEILATVLIFVFVAAVVVAGLVFGATVVAPAIIGKVGAAIAGAGAVGAAGATAATTASAALLSKAAIGVIVVTAIKTGVTAGVVAGAYANSEWFGNEVVLTLYQITPEEIFTGELELLNANFFKSSSSAGSNEADNWSQTLDYNVVVPNADSTELNKQMRARGYEGEDISINKCGIGQKNQESGVITKWVDKNSDNKKSYSLIYSANAVSTDESGAVMVTKLVISISDNAQPMSIAQQIKDSIAKWYYTIRNLSLALMMPILIYIGIRMILTSISSEKAKYKRMLGDWIVAICLIFVMQYIMIFAVNIVEGITDLVKNSVGAQEYDYVITDKDGKIEKALEDAGLWDESLKSGDEIVWTTNNIMGIIRTTAAISNGGTYTYIGYALSFVVLVWYTIFFLFTYLKRVIYLAFLTVIAPFVAMTYPLDKISDGKAQAFDMWLKEYIFNLLIQPMHLILYTILISMAYELASTNIVYTLVAIGFMMPAEKLLRRFFGFEKAQTPGALGGAAGAAIVMNGLNHIFRRPPGKKEQNSAFGTEKPAEDRIMKFTNPSGHDDKELFDGEVNADDGLLGLTRFADWKNKRDEEKTTNNTQSAEELIRFADWKKQRNEENNSVDNIKSGLGSNNNSVNMNMPISSEPIENPNLSRWDKFKVKMNKKPVIRGFNKAKEEYARQWVNKSMKNLSSGKNIRRIGRGITGAAVGAGAGMLGATLGIASGDISKVGQYGAVGLAGGYALGSHRGPSSLDMKEISKEYQKGYYGSEEAYRKAELENARKEYIKDDKKAKEIQEKLKCKSIEDARKLMEEHKKFIEAGYTDTDDLATMIKMVEERGWSEEKTMTVAKFSNSLPTKPSSMGKKDTEEFEFRCKKIAKANNVPDSQIDETVNKIRTNAEDFLKQKGSLQDI